MGTIPPPADSFQRWNPAEIERSIAGIRRGRLKIFLGAVTGAGKTYRMLREGNTLLERGRDVVIGLVETHGRVETEEQVGALAVIPPLRWHDADGEHEDLDVDAILARDPEVVLVDALGRANRPGAPRPTRYDDVQVLLDAGINVLATMNAYTLASVDASVHAVTGDVLPESVPPDALEKAFEVELVDVTPAELLVRIQGGQLGQTDASAAMRQQGNLAVLREIALRELAEEVDTSLDAYRRQHGMQGPSGATERIMVACQYRYSARLLLERGVRLARRLNADLKVVVVRDLRRELDEAQAAERAHIRERARTEGFTLEEVDLAQYRSPADALASVAVREGITRLVLGHSAHSRLEEAVKGSIVHHLLRNTRNMDLYVVAPRSEENDAVLRRRRAPDPNPYRRLTQAEIDDRVKALRRGRLKVYLGYAPGVGKTYTMLRDARRLREKGIDVVVGYLEPHDRAETIAQLGDLPVVPRRRIVYRGTAFEEMDTDAILERRPDVVLVDELAHTNVPGSERPKRYMDVERLLDAGIHVISTLNVQHLEGLNDVVEQITGIKVRETLPDRVLEAADEIQLIDISPHALRNRMRDGKIYAPRKVDQALHNFFRTGNLGALREIVLRELERCDMSFVEPAPLQEERVLVAVKLGPNAERVIRRGFRLAHRRQRAPWQVLHVSVGDTEPPEVVARYQRMEELVRALGGEITRRRVRLGRDVARAILREIEATGATQLVVGQSGRRRFEEFKRPSVVDEILRQARTLDIMIVADPFIEARTDAAVGVP